VCAKRRTIKRVIVRYSQLYGEIRNATGTFWAAVLIHGVGIAFGHPLEADFVNVTAGMGPVGSISTGFFVIAFAFLFTAVIIRWQMSKRAVVSTNIGYRSSVLTEGSFS
jgi:hypothetical protein